MPAAGLPLGFPSSQTSSFSEFLRDHSPELLPGPPRGEVEGTHATTIVALTFRGGALVAGDRRATMGNLIAQRDVDKVHITDEYSAAGIAGTGLALEMVRLFAVELEHYEKLEGTPLSLDGKANRLAGMVRGNLDAAMMGLVAIPVLAGYDLDATDPDRAGRIVSFDVTGSRNEERAGYYAIGSGSVFARSALKKRFSPQSDVEDALRAAVEALYDAADDDSATGGPDVNRQIYPTAVVITSEGARKLDQASMSTVAEAVVADRRQNPGG